MTIGAATEIEKSANRKPWEFWKSRVHHSLPELGNKTLYVVRGVTSLPDGQRQVELRFSHFGYYAGKGLFTGYPFARQLGVKPTLEQLEKDNGWQTMNEWDGQGPQDTTLAIFD